MGYEIERKFLVTSDAFRQEATMIVPIRQVYLTSASEDFVVRLRIIEQKAILTLKNKVKGSRFSRGEWEYEIPLEEAEEMCQSAKTSPIVKERYIVPMKQYLWEVDCFHGALEGLVLAEIELSTEEDSFTFPSWIGKEVTADPRYYNAVLALEGLPTAKSFKS